MYTCTSFFFVHGIFFSADKKLERAKVTQVVQQPMEAMSDDAAGFKKPLRFRCISCDKPVGIKPLNAIPALPSISMFPGTRSFRPYTTYELELIRRHQKMLALLFKFVLMPT